MIKLLEKIVKEAYKADFISVANKTSRTNGASSRNSDGSIRSVVARYIMETADKDESILDFGAGKDAVQTLALRDAGFTNVTAYDFGTNLIDGVHEAGALSRSYYTVFASNVLNVSSDEAMLRETVMEIFAAVKHSGRCVFNYPASPRKSGLSAKQVAEIITEELGITPEKCAGTNSAPVWEIYKV